MLPQGFPSLPARADFPAGFVFGLSAAAYQIEGTAGAGPCHWDSFAATPGSVRGGVNGRQACGHRVLFPQDLDLAAAAGVDAWRFSTSWARLQPEGPESFSERGLAFYDRLVDGICARGMKPALTLYHGELPAWAADRGGWANRDTALRLADLAAQVGARLGDRLWSAAPVNAPAELAWAGHFHGRHAPGLRDIRAASRALHHALLAQGLGVQALRAAAGPQIGAVLDFTQLLPADERPAAAEATARHDLMQHRAVLGPLFGQGYPAALLEALGPHLPRRAEADLDTIAQPLDWLGVSYHTRRLVAPANAPWPALSTGPGTRPTCVLGRESAPEGLLERLVWLRDTLTGDLPLIVTENGMAAPDRQRDGDGMILDADRVLFLAEHLDACREAIAEGVPLAGYMIRSLLDGFEWEAGFSAGFGLVEVDHDSLQRRPKASYHAVTAALGRRV
ncbi:family 1 glycosylhydrolase [Phaeovulum vinaykumarii]|uniref:beta-glucosidase n=1 Tax=Phaeovulum vinaykumarii TaxID=407234 RepID=A0A1N7LJP2_9RHOB|nr:family 1 glycosylhydrolase [Phaeovulum vinaykumarii]SIS74004.1 beta-glucosidase [Phaeovulum vinaykumarii]SOC04849.1 beta-glucosidase [Phaeovulum vinaykumarii]